LSIIDDFKQGRELQKKYTEKQTTVVARKKSKPNKLILGLGIAYEMLQVDKVITTFKEVFSAIKQKSIPVLLVMFDDIKNIGRKPDEETAFHRWQVSEKFSELGKRFRR
jgi:hypothetical protein